MAPSAVQAMRLGETGQRVAAKTQEMALPIAWFRETVALAVVDNALKPCNEQDDDACETPWDYCCDTDLLPEHKAMWNLEEGKYTARFLPSAVVFADGTKVAGPE